MLDLWKAKRREARILLAIPVTIEGLDKFNAPFREEAVADNVSKNGVCLVLDQTLDLGAVLTVTACQGKFKCKGEVRALWVDDNDRKKRVGVRFVDPTVNWVVS
ncbi:MAG: PilZ domain-containing protein [Acidobacteria bacterium]|nr:PilZ domain-containing protein [Acidobacteriota bacterium]